MRTIAAALSAAALLSAGAAVARPSPDEQLAKLIAGRLAGKPVSCIELRSVQASHVIDKQAIVYEIGGVRYVNRPRSGASSLDDDYILVTRTPTQRLCRSDSVRLVDRNLQVPMGFVLLGDFVPYRKAPATAGGE